MGDSNFHSNQGPICSPGFVDSGMKPVEMMKACLVWSNILARRPVLYPFLILYLIGVNSYRISRTSGFCCVNGLLAQLIIFFLRITRLSKYFCGRKMRHIARSPYLRCGLIISFGLKSLCLRLRLSKCSRRRSTLISRCPKGWK